MLSAGRRPEAVLLENVLIIFVKYPKPGSVKTRLAKQIGKENAALLYRLFVKTILSATEDKGFARLIFYAPRGKRNEIKDWIGPDSIIYPQMGDGLGERLSNAFRLAFKKGAKRVVVIGSDSPAIDRKVIRRAFRELEKKDCVIGPALDGGYYLLGLSSFCEELFCGIDWSTEKVFQQTLDKIGNSKMKVSILEENFDVDEVEDLIAFKARND